MAPPPSSGTSPIRVDRVYWSCKCSCGRRAAASSCLRPGSPRLPDHCQLRRHCRVPASPVSRSDRVACSTLACRSSLSPASGPCPPSRFLTARSIATTTSAPTSPPSFRPSPSWSSQIPPTMASPRFGEFRFSPTAIDVSTAPATVNVEFDVHDDLAGSGGGLGFASGARTCPKRAHRRSSGTAPRLGRSPRRGSSTAR